MSLWLVGFRYYNTWAPRKLNVLTSFLLPSFRFRNNCFQLDREAGRSFTILSLLSLLPTTNPLCSSAVPVAVSLYSPSDPVTPALLPANEEQIFPCCYNMGSRSNSPAKPSSPLIVRLIAVSKWGFVYFTPKDSRWSRYICCFLPLPSFNLWLSAARDLVLVAIHGRLRGNNGAHLELAQVGVLRARYGGPAPSDKNVKFCALFSLPIKSVSCLSRK